MKTKPLFLKAILLTAIVITVICCKQQRHPYASDTPIHTPRIFSIPGPLGNENTWHITFTPEGDEYYFIVESKIGLLVMYSSFENGKWTIPDTASFSGKYSIETPSISPDGSKLLFAKCIYEDQKSKDDLYETEKIGSEWSEPKAFDAINTLTFEACPQRSKNGNLYFFSKRKGENMIFVARNENNSLKSPEEVSPEINSFGPSEFFVAPDESYILFGKRNDGIYYSYKKDDINWSTPKKINILLPIDGRPYISPDGNYLFFTRHGDWNKKEWKIYQVDWKPILDSLKRL